jgi:hypothetical protein
MLAAALVRDDERVTVAVRIAASAVTRAAQRAVDQDPALWERVLWDVLASRPQWQRRDVQYEFTSATPTFVPSSPIKSWSPTKSWSPRSAE